MGVLGGWAFYYERGTPVRHRQKVGGTKDPPPDVAPQRDVTPPYPLQVKRDYRGTSEHSGSRVGRSVFS